MFGKKWFALLAAALLLPVFSGSALAADTIKLGLPGAHTGDLAGYGLPAMNAATLVVEDINAKGGILGMKVEILAQDDQCKPELATNAATKLVTDGAIVAMGPTCTGATKAALPILMDKKIVTISPSATAPDLTQSGANPYFFRTIPSDDAQARFGVDFIQKSLKGKKIAIIHDKGDYGKGYAEFAKKFIEADGVAEVVFFEGITPGGVDYSATIMKVARTGADTILFGGYYPEASKLVTAIRSQGLEVNFVSEDGVKTDAFLELAGQDGEGVYASSSLDNSHRPAYKAATAAHEAKYGGAPGQFFYEAHAATTALLNAIQKAGSTDPDAIVKVLHTEDCETTLGAIHFDEKGDAVGIGFTMYKVVDGKYEDTKFSQQ